jgi:hypothetical protein
MESCGGAINLLSGSPGELENRSVIGQGLRSIQSFDFIHDPSPTPISQKPSSVLFTASHVLSPIMFMIELLFITR